MDELWGWAALAAVFAMPILVARLLFGRSRTSSMSDPSVPLFDSSRSTASDIERGRGAGASGGSNA
jgi:hypothetical protein